MELNKALLLEEKRQLHNLISRLNTNIFEDINSENLYTENKNILIIGNRIISTIPTKEHEYLSVFESNCFNKSIDLSDLQTVKLKSAPVIGFLLMVIFNLACCLSHSPLAGTS